MVFEVFRSRQKEMLVALTLLAMFAFVFAGVIDRFTARELSGSDSVIATAWGKDITAGQVMRMQQDRMYANTFIAKARSWLMLPDIGPQFDTSPNGAIEALVILEKARRMDLSVSNEMVTEYINAVTENKLGKADFHSVLSGGSRSGKRDEAPMSISEMDLYRILGDEIMIIYAIRALSPPVILDTPYDLWADREVRLTKVRLETVKIPVDAFASQVGEPTDEQLQKVYEQYKDQVGVPSEGIMGFKRPAKADAQYLVAKVEQYLDKVTVTPEEVQKYYDEHQEEFQEELPTPPADNKESEEKSEVPAPPEDPSSEIPVPPAEPTKDAPEGESKESAKEEDKPSTQDEEPKSEEPKTEDPTPSEDKPQEGEAPKSEDSRRSTGSLRGLLSSVIGTSLFAEEEKKEAGPDEKEEPKVTPTEDSKRVDAPVQDPPTAGVEPPPPAPSLPAAPKVKPLEAVRADIEKKLKERKAGELILADFRSIVNDTMNVYLDTYLEAKNRYRDSKQGKPESKEKSAFEPPPLPDLAKIAASKGFEFKETGLVTAEEAGKIPGIGESVRVQRDDSFEQPLGFPVLLFDQPEFRGRVSRNDSADEYFLYWKTKSEPAAPLPFEEAKPEVIAAWKLIEAGPKAKEAAEKLAEEIRKGSGNVEAAIPPDSGFTFAATNEFERFTTIRNPMLGRDTIADPTLDEIPNAGRELLDAVFKVEQGDVVVATDATKQNYYVIKVVSRQEPAFSQYADFYGMEMSILRDPRFLAQRPEPRNQLQRTMFSIIQESKLQMTNAGKQAVADE